MAHRIKPVHSPLMTTVDQRTATECRTTSVLMSTLASGPQWTTDHCPSDDSGLTDRKWSAMEHRTTLDESCLNDHYG